QNMYIYSHAFPFTDYGIKNGFYRETAPSPDVRDTFRLMTAPDPITRVRDVNTKSVEAAITSLWQRFPPLVASIDLRQSTNTTVAADVTVSRERLLVQNVIPHI